MENIQHIFTDQIDDPEFAMRTEINRNELFELADNIKQNGLINPITVRPKNGRFEVVAGHRRFSACKIAGIIKIQCVVRELDDNQTFSIMAAENLERADVDPVDEANFIVRYMEQTGYTISQVSKSLRRSINYVESRLAVGKMPDYMQAYLKSGDLKLGAALALLEINDPRILRVYVDTCVRDGVSVAQADYFVHTWKMSILPGGANADTPPNDFVAGEVAPIQFECALDGKKYDARMFKSVFIYEGNYDLFNLIVSEFRKAPPTN